MSNLQQCHEDHRQLASVSSGLARVLARDVPPSANVLDDLRQKFACILIRHLETEDRRVYPKLLRSSDPHVAKIAQFFVSEMGGLALAFREHSERWSADVIDSDWDGYRRETAHFLVTLNKRMTREERDLYPLCDVSPVPTEAPVSQHTS